MKRTINAIFFDLYDTLTYPDEEQSIEKIHTSAKLCGVKPEQFEKIWKGFVVESNLGKYPTTQDRVRAVIKKMGIMEYDSLIEAVTQAEHTFLLTGMLLYEDTISTLIMLRRMGLKLGLITNASPSVHIVLQQHKLREYMDTFVISSEVGIRKPDPEIYLLALKDIGIEASKGIFVGDGNDRELDGAKRVGLITICIPPRKKKYGYTQGSSPECIDYQLYSLAELPDLIRHIQGND